MKKYLWIFCIVITISIGVIYRLNDGKNTEVKGIKNLVILNELERKELNNYLTLFSKYKLEDFKEDYLIDENIINFAVAYNFDNYFERFNIYKEKCCAYIDEKYIEDTVNKYFGRDIKLHGTTKKYEFIEDKYIAPLASGGGYNFSKIINLYEIGKDKLIAEMEIYHAESSFMGDINDSKEQWEKGEGEVPELIGKKRAILKKENNNENIKYIILSYENVQ